MNEADQKSVPNTKKVFLNLAACYAIIVPAVFAIFIAVCIKRGNSSPHIHLRLAASLFISSFVVGTFLSMFGRSLGVTIRALVFVGMLVNAAIGGLLLSACYNLISYPSLLSK